MSSKIRHFHHVGITVQSLERSLAFYRDLLGFEEVFAWQPRAEYLSQLVGYPDVELNVAFVALPGTDTRIELLEYTSVGAQPADVRNGNPGTGHVAFVVDDVDALFERLEAAGVSYVSVPVTPTIGANKGGRAVYMIDPDGFRVEFFKPATVSDAAPVTAVESDTAEGCC